MQRTLKLAPLTSTAYEDLAWAYSVTGQSYTAMVYTGLGETDRALDLLEQAVEERRVSLNIKVRRAYAPLRSEPRFQAVLEKMGLD